MRTHVHAQRAQAPPAHKAPPTPKPPHLVGWHSSSTSSPTSASAPGRAASPFRNDWPVAMMTSCDVSARGQVTGVSWRSLEKAPNLGRGGGEVKSQVQCLI